METNLTAGLATSIQAAWRGYSTRKNMAKYFYQRAWNALDNDDGLE